MNKGLDLIKRQQPEIINGFPTGNIYVGVTKEELVELEKELKEHEQYKAIEERLGIDLIKYLKLQLDGGYFKVPDSIVEEFCTSFKPNEVVGRIPDSVSPEGIRLTYYDRWDNTCKPIKYLYSWANEGKTWALTREELK